MPQEIEHVVVLMMENRSFDHMLGWLQEPGYDIDGLTVTMCLLLTEKELRQDIIQKGMKRAQKFSWAETAKKTLEVYYKVGRE